MEVSVKPQSRKINKIEYNTVGKKYFFKQKQQQAARCLTSQRARKKQQTNKYKVHSQLRCSVFTTKPKRTAISFHIGRVFKEMPYEELIPGVDLVSKKKKKISGDFCLSRAKHRPVTVSGCWRSDWTEGRRSRCCSVRLLPLQQHTAEELLQAGGEVQPRLLGVDQLLLGAAQLLRGSALAVALP